MLLFHYFSWRGSWDCRTNFLRYAWKRWIKQTHSIVDIISTLKYLFIFEMLYMCLMHCKRSLSLCVFHVLLIFSSDYRAIPFRIGTHSMCLVPLLSLPHHTLFFTSSMTLNSQVRWSNRGYLKSWRRKEVSIYLLRRDWKCSRNLCKYWYLLWTVISWIFKWSALRWQTVYLILCGGYVTSNS